MPPLIRPAALTDVPVLNDIIRAAFATVARDFNLTPNNCPAHPSNSQPEWVTKAMDRGVSFFLLEEDGRAAGCVALEQAGPDLCYMERLAVPPALRNQGRGLLLVRQALDIAAARGARRVEIATIAGQLDLRHWYEKQGFIMIRTARFDHLPFEVAFLGLDLVQEPPTA
jgi:GNAT superfamily N-acetyltransferase